MVHNKSKKQPPKNVDYLKNIVRETKSSSNMDLTNTEMISKLLNKKSKKNMDVVISKKEQPKPVKVEPKPVKVEPKPVKVEPKPVKVEPKPVKVEPKPKVEPRSYETTFSIFQITKDKNQVSSTLY